MKTWMCSICGWIYDEAKGSPDDGIQPGTRWEDVPADWTCRGMRGCQDRLRDDRDLKHCTKRVTLKQLCSQSEAPRRKRIRAYTRSNWLICVLD